MIYSKMSSGSLCRKYRLEEEIMKKTLAFLMAAIMLVLGIMVPVNAEETVPTGVYGTDFVKYGDINRDEDINATDALMALQCAVEKITLDETQLQVANVNADQSIDAVDALNILQLAVDILDQFDAGVYYIVNQQGGNENPPEPPAPVDGNFITLYDKNNSVNGAYVKDSSADTSFVVDAEQLQPLTIYRLAGTVLNKSTDEARLVYSLQGLINRDYGMDKDHSTLLYVLSSEDDNGWYTELTAKDTIMEVTKDETQELLKAVPVKDFDDFYNIFSGVIKQCGIVLWDGNVPATANVAATICGLDGYLPVLAESPLHKRLVEDGVEVKQSLVGLFKDGQKGQNIADTTIKSTGSAKNDAYRWALEKYFDRCTTGYLAYILDGAVTIKGYDAYEDHHLTAYGDAGSNCLQNHDYLIARRCFFFDLAPYAGEAACDDPAQKNGQAAHGTDYETMKAIFQARYDRANGAFGALMGFPPWWIKYTKHNNQGGQQDTWVEWLYCEIITCYNLAKEADAAHPCAMANGSVFYKYVPRQSQYTNNKKAENITFDKNTYYYTIYVGDYDSSAWLKQHIYNMWVKRGGDRNRGSVYLMWSINPNLSYRVPMIFDYMYENKTDMDYFAGGDGGAGYIIPSGLFHDQTLSYLKEKRPAGNAEAGQVFADYSKPFYKRFDMDITGFLINGANGDINKKIATCVNQYSPLGSFANHNQPGVLKYNGTYYVNCLTGIASTGAESSMYDFANKAIKKSQNFGAYRTVCHTPTQIKGNVTNFESYAAEKGMKVKYCDPYTYFNLLKQSGQGTEIK